MYILNLFKEELTTKFNELIDVSGFVDSFIIFSTVLNTLNIWRKSITALKKSPSSFSLCVGSKSICDVHESTPRWLNSPHSFRPLATLHRDRSRHTEPSFFDFILKFSFLFCTIQTTWTYCLIAKKSLGFLWLYQRNVIKKKSRR